MEVLDNVAIENRILPHLSLAERGKGSKVEMTTLIEAIIYKLKTACQWRQLPVKHFFDEEKLTWQGVYQHFNEWRKDGSWKRVWLTVLRLNKRFLDLSSRQLDGSHTLAEKGGQAVGYQGRKAARTTTSLFLADNSGVLLACATPQAGNHHGLVETEYDGEHRLRLSFSDGTSQVVGFDPFLQNHPHPQYNKYRHLANFKRFRIERGNTVWGRDWDLIFPVAQPHQGYVAPVVY